MRSPKPSPESMTDTPPDSMAFEETEDFSHELTTNVLSLFAGQGVAGLERPPDGYVYSAEFDLGGSVPRALGRRHAFTSEDVYIRLENTVYGPITQDRLVELLNSGALTGYESASSDLQHWTPLLYHPAMNLSGEADPDLTHEILHENSSLPQAAPRRIRLEDLADEDAVLPEEARPPQTPLAAIMLKPKKIRVKVKKTLDLPVLGDIEEDGVDTLRERAEKFTPDAPLETLHAPTEAVDDEEIVGANDNRMFDPPAEPDMDVDSDIDPGFGSVGDEILEPEVASDELEPAPFDAGEPDPTVDPLAADHPAEGHEPERSTPPTPPVATAATVAEAPAGASVMGMLLSVAIVVAAVLVLWFAMPR